MLSITASVNWWARTEPHRTALVYGDQSLSYSDLQQRMMLAARFLAEQGVQSGDVVALMMKNSAAFLELSLAISYVGAVFLPLNYRLGREEAGYITGHAGVKLLLADDELRQNVPDDIPTVYLDAVAQRDSRRLAGISGPDEGGCGHAEHFPASNEAPQALSHHASVPSPCEVRPESLYRLMYTSGTTDRPKGVMHTYSNMAWKCLDHITALGLGTDDRLLVVGPLYHVGAYDLPGVAIWMVGGAMILEREFAPERALELIGRERITGVWMAPIMLNRCLGIPDRSLHQLGSLKWLIGGGERTPEERIRSFGDLFPNARYIDAYGLTETCSGDTMMEAGREIEKIGSTGRALPNVQLAVMNDEGRALPAGEQGEIWIRGPKVSPGYWRDEAKTQASFIGDWFRTGDVGFLDSDGFLFLTDRRKDMIISGGENIASSEVERVIYQLPQVMEAAAIGLPDPQWGECVTAVVVLAPGTTLTLEALRSHCAGKLGTFKIPKKLLIYETLPRNPSGKVLKRELRVQLARS